MTNEQDKPDKFMEILCDPKRGPVEWERPAWRERSGFTSRPLRGIAQAMVGDAYRTGLVQGMAGMRSLECHGPDDCAPAYALGWMRGTFPRPFEAEEAKPPASNDSDA